MPTLIAVFTGRDDTETVLNRLVEHGIDRGSIGLVWREKTTRQAEDIEVVTYVDHFERPMAEAKKGVLGGVIGGATAGAGTVLLATCGVWVATEDQTAISIRAAGPAAKP